MIINCKIHEWTPWYWRIVFLFLLLVQFSKVVRECNQVTVWSRFPPKSTIFISQNVLIVFSSIVLQKRLVRLMKLSHVKGKKNTIVTVSRSKWTTGLPVKWVCRRTERSGTHMGAYDYLLKKKKKSKPPWNSLSPLSSSCECLNFNTCARFWISIVLQLLLLHLLAVTKTFSFTLSHFLTLCK